MKKAAILFLCYFLIGIAGKSQPASLKWVKSFGNASDNDQANAVCIDLKKNVFVAGIFKGTVDFDPSLADTANLTSTGTYSAFVAKFDSNGNFIWAKSFGGTSYASAATITTDHDGNVITAGNYFQTVDFDPSDSVSNLTSMGTYGVSSIFIQKLDPDGNFIWAISIGSNSATTQGSGRANQIATDDSNNIYLAGQVSQNGTLDFDPGPGIINSTTGKAFLARYDTAGNLTWVSTFGNIGGSGASARSLCFSKGYLYVAGSSTYGVGSISGLLVRKIDLLGTGIWQKRVGASNSLYGYSISADNDGNVITTGSFNNTSVDFDPGDGIFALNDENGTGFIQKLDPLGNFVWAKNFKESITSVATDIDNNIYTAGSFTGTVDFDSNEPVFSLKTAGSAAYIQKLDANGYLLWAGQFGNSGSGTTRGLVSDSMRNIYLTGNYTGTQDFDPDSSMLKVFNTSSVSGSQDIFVLKLKDPQAYITRTNGNWNAGATWLGGIVPPVDAGVIVRHVITVTQNAECYSLIVEKPNGAVTVKDGLALTVNH